MAQIHEMQAADMDVASEFLEMAARLVHIKSVSLLPKKEEEAALKQELTGQLLEYQQCKEAAMRSRASGFRSTASCVRRRIFPQIAPISAIISRRSCFRAYLSMLGRKKPPEPQKPEDTISKLITRRVVSVASQIVFVLRSLWKKRHVSLKRAVPRQKRSLGARGGVPRRFGACRCRTSDCAWTVTAKTARSN